ncbi:MAG TPA: hypothetical protein VGO08_02110 [Burkholderiales bacterium]|nr:hypothetical protein [Burkholderiales bacterium]
MRELAWRWLPSGLFEFVDRGTDDELGSDISTRLTVLASDNEEIVI